MTQPITDAPSHHEARVTMSYEEWLMWAGESTQAEWVNGEGIKFVPPKTVQAVLASFLTILLGLYARRLGLGTVIAAPFEMRLVAIPSAREPDVLFVSHAHRDRLTAERLIGPADLAIEIVSDDSVSRDRRDKLVEYERGGVSEYWILDPRRRQERANFSRLDARGRYREVSLDADGRYHSTALTGFWLRPEWLWQDPLPDPLVLLETIAPDSFRRS